MDEKELSEQRDRHEAWLAKQPGVTGIGIGLGTSGNRCLMVFTDHMPADLKEQIRQRLKGVPVDFEETGEFRAL